jgi:DNA-binding transcriptional MerR regulator
MPELLSVGDVAARLDVEPWQIRRLFERGLLPAARRVGGYRVVPSQDLPRVERALRAAGYLPEPAAAS